MALEARGSLVTLYLLSGRPVANAVAITWLVVLLPGSLLLAPVVFVDGHDDVNNI